MSRPYPDHPEHTRTTGGGETTARRVFVIPSPHERMPERIVASQEDMLFVLKGWAREPATLRIVTGWGVDP